MNAVEHIVELYFRLVRNCFTFSDIKIEGGNNRQIDLLAYSLKTLQCYHVETTVAHDEKWAISLAANKEYIKQKFFGEPKNLRPDNSNTDFSKGKTYRAQIEAVYQRFNIDSSNLIRVCCRWCPKKGEAEVEDWKNEIAAEYGLQPSNFELLYFRDDVLPALHNAVKTANYDDEILRTISLFKAQAKQMPSSS